MMYSGHHKSIVGGMFGLPDSPSHRSGLPPIVGDNCLFTTNARSAVYSLVQLLSPGRVWVPSYLCHTIIDGVHAAQGRICFYGIDANLNIESQNWIEDVQPSDIVILIDYFGCLCDATIAESIRQRGAWVLEDACQAMLTSGAGSIGDFVIISPRKYIGVPDGAILRSNRPEVNFADIELSPPPPDWWRQAVAAAVLRRSFDVDHEQNSWYQIYRIVDDTQPIGSYAMSELSRSLLSGWFDFDDVARKRIDNFNTLARYLSDIAIIPDIPQDVVPLGFPVRLKNRDSVRNKLYANRIYAPVHWDLRNIVPDEFAESHRLAEEILTIPCDQRYSTEDMTKIAQAISHDHVGEI